MAKTSHITVLLKALGFSLDDGSIETWVKVYSNYNNYKIRVDIEAEMGGTFRTPGRDSWPTALKDLFAEFERGNIPTISLNRMMRERMVAGGCRVCAM